MPEYFVIRSTVNESEKKWIFNELRAGRLRQGWFAHKGTSLVDKKGLLVPEDIWVEKLRAVVSRCCPEPKTQQERRWTSESFAPRKYHNFKQMLDIPDGARIIVPKLDPNGREKGFVLARAASASRKWRLRSGCYAFDEKERSLGEPATKDLRHVFSVDPASVRPIGLDTQRAKRISEGLEKRQHPIRRSVNEEFNVEIERIYVDTLPVPEGFKPNPVSGTAQIKEREPIDAELLLRQGQEKFRQELLQHYKQRCAISGCDVEPTLEAAHIRTYDRADVSHVTNGLLLRADLHKLFDAGLISVKTSSWTVVVAHSLKDTTYWELNGETLKLPLNDAAWPKKALDHHYRNKFKRELD